MGIMAGGAGEGIAGFELAFAAVERFELAGGAKIARGTGENKIVDVVLQIIARTKLIELATGLANRYVAFQMALHADGIAPPGGKFGGIHDWAHFFDVIVAGTVTAFTANALLGD